MELAPKIRFHPFFGAKGTNVNFVQIKDKDLLWMRTYERGVESETQACGTGAIASAIAATLLFSLSSPIKIFPTSKIPIEISLNFSDKGISDIRMSGPAEKIFSGEFVLD